MSIQKNMVYAMKNGEITHISEVERGLACGCICPACGAKLVARKGKVMAHHFAHYSGETCEYGYESSLHLAAKEILSQSAKMTIPSVWINFDYKPKICLSEAQEIPITKVVLEKKFSEVIPDLVVYSGNTRLFVEIYVTHAIDEIKLAKLKRARASTIEIDLSKLDKEITLEGLENILLSDSPQKVWKYNDEAAQWHERFCDVAEKMETVMRGFAMQVDYCPIAARTWHGKPYANFIDDCLGCEYNVKTYDYGALLCTGKRRIATLADFEVPDKERIEKKQKDEESKNLEKIFQGICPNCGAKLCERHGPYGVFGGCTNYPHCRFTVSIDDETGELIIKA